MSFIVLAVMYGKVAKIVYRTLGTSISRTKVFYSRVPGFYRLLGL